MTSKLTRLTDEELEELAFYAGESICHPDPNYQLGFESLATGHSILSIVRELQERRKAAMDSEPVAWLAIYHGEVYDEAIGITRSVVEAQAHHFGWESALTEIIPLYRHAQQPVVAETARSSVIAEQLAHVLSDMKVTDHQRAVISCAVDRLNNVAQLLQLSPSALLVPEILDYQGGPKSFITT